MAHSKISGADYCSMGHSCHVNATCLNLNTKYLCVCNSGLQGDGFNCIGKSAFTKIHLISLMLIMLANV